MDNKIVRTKRSRFTRVTRVLHNNFYVTQAPCHTRVTWMRVTPNDILLQYV